MSQACDFGGKKTAFLLCVYFNNYLSFVLHFLSFCSFFSRFSYIRDAHYCLSHITSVSSVSLFNPLFSSPCLPPSLPLPHRQWKEWKQDESKRVCPRSSCCSAAIRSLRACQDISGTNTHIYNTHIVLIIPVTTLKEHTRLFLTSPFCRHHPIFCKC